MSKNKKPEWVKFKIGEPSTNNNWTNINCQSFSTIAHVAHISTALNIVEDGKIHSGLIYDESKLNADRILVTWLSPNDWHGSGGFRYGHIRFTFDWRKIINDMQAYWVESMAYGIEACRILLTTTDYSSFLQKYDPTIPNGPWWHDKINDTHYWNGHYCLEIMLERDVRISEALKVDFVDHHPDFCSIQPGSCPDSKIRSSNAGAIFVSSIVSRDISHNLPSFLEKKSDKIVPNYAFRESCIEIWEKLKEQECNGTIIFKNNVARPLARSILNAYAQSNDKEIAQLCSLFKSHRTLFRSCAVLICEYFQINKWSDIVPAWLLKK